LNRTEAATGAVTLIQRFGSAANLNIHLHCLFLDGVYCTTDEGPVFQPVKVPTAEQLQMKYFKTFDELRTSVLEVFRSFLDDATQVIRVMKKLRTEAGVA
jgi:hypothetical protein